MTDRNADKTLAQKLLALAMDLMSASAPVPVPRLRERHFSGLKDEAARKKLARARETLESCGLIIVQTRKNGTLTWSVDPRCYPQGALEPTDTELVRLLTSPLLGDEGFAHRGDLRLALMKLGVSPAGNDTAVEDNHVLETLRFCLGSHRMVELDYEDVAGNETHRRVAPLGLFDLRGHTYLVASNDGSGSEESIRTLRADRMSHARRTNDTFDYPADFDVNDYRLLPFQMGPTVATCTFRVPKEASPRLVETTLGEGRLYEDEDGTLWDVAASNLGDAASWAIAYGLTPVAPAELVECWQQRLRGCLA